MRRTALTYLTIMLSLAAIDNAEAAYRAYVVNGKTSDGKCVSQKFVWDQSRVSKPKIMSQAAGVKAAFGRVSKKYSLGEMKSKKHLPSLLNGRVPNDGTVTYDPPKSC